MTNQPESGGPSLPRSGSGLPVGNGPLDSTSMPASLSKSSDSSPDQNSASKQKPKPKSQTEGDVTQSLPDFNSKAAQATG